MKLIDEKLIKFIIVGGINTLVGTAVMFGAYNLLGINYWISSALNYVVGSIVSYLLNRNFTFKSNDSQKKSIPKFILNIFLCYTIAYGIAQPVVKIIFSELSTALRDNIAMLIGMCLFVGINYIGQRYFVFNSESLKQKNKV
ncbi:GtrA family protein [Eisenbergiella tayi]|uniref:GtrA family protein n=1 Tax=Eisenbergiella tayi TaxID=1432052 RepID=UPI000A55F110|nr:GtrA family protein [Eisenbergiella tayi]